MKILKLTIHNIASIADAVIDFTLPPLSDAGLFLISGKTGAGKSTILDCICLALYDETPRLSSTLIRDDVKDSNSDDSISSNDTRQMLRKYSAEGFTELEFIGNNNIHYRATWIVNRAHKKATGKLQSTKRTLERLDNNSVLTKKGEINSEIATAVNLDFRQFCRTVMLAQGEFTKFLNSNDNDKSAILSKITGTEIYAELGKRIYERYREELRTLENCRMAVDSLEMLSEEELEAKVQSLKALDSESVRITENMERQAKIITSLENIEKYNKEIINLKNKLAESVADYWVYSGEIKKLEKKAAKFDEDIANTENELTKFNDVLPVLKDSSEIISLIGRIEDTDKNIEADHQTLILNELQKNEKFIPERDKAKNAADEIQTEIKSVKDEILRLTTELDKLNLPQLRKDKEDLMQMGISFENLNIHLDAYNRICAEREETVKAITNNKKEADELRLKIENLNEPILKAGFRLEAMQSAYDKLFASSEKILSKIRSSLAVGDTCPLCHYKIVNQLPAEAEIASVITDSKKDVDNARSELESLNKDLADLNAALSVKDKEIKRLNAIVADTSRLSETEYKIKSLASALNLEIDSVNPDQLKSIYSENIKNIAEQDLQLKEKISEGDILEKSLKSQNILLDTLRKKEENLQKAHNDAIVKLTACDSLILSLKDHIKNAEQNLEGLKESLKRMVLNTRYENLANEPGTIKRVIMTDQKNHDMLSETLKKLVSSRELLLMNITTHKAACESLRQLLPEDIAEPSSYENLPSFNSDLNSFSREIIGAVKTNNELLNIACKNLSEEQNHIESYRTQNPDSDLSLESIYRSYTDNKDNLESINREIGAVQSLLARDTENREKKLKLVEEYRNQEQTLEKWKKLYDLFGDAEGKKFRKIAQSYILSELIRSANHYLSGFTDRYTLSIEPGTFVIMVEDAWDGYSRRPASTISGGESFMVSLSLALALSDLNSDFSVDTLFIDEGFGSLSSEYLQSAINTLRTLHNRSGRRVGIISHVEELRERIPVQICVESSPNSSASKVIVSPEL